MLLFYIFQYQHPRPRADSANTKKTARWSVTSVVLVLILASTSAAADEKITADGYSDEIGILKEASFTEGAGGRKPFSSVCKNTFQASSAIFSVRVSI